MTRDETFLTVSRQAIVEDAKTVDLEGRCYPVQRTSRHRLRQVDFTFGGEELRGLEQNPNTAPRWARMAREGKKVMQFLSKGRYIAVVADGAATAARASTASLMMLICSPEMNRFVQQHL